MKLRARLSRWLPICVAVAATALAAGACSVPKFEFPEPPAPGAAGDAPGDLPPVEHCVNGLKDADLGESDFDCGRGCAPCGAGKACGDVADCEDGLLCHDGVCIAAGCINDARDGTETDVDCGGDSCKACITGQTCESETDCDSGVCTDATCLAPACDDQTLNGKETGLDCGGDCSPCPVDQPCIVDKDCISAACNDKICGAECPDGFADCNRKNRDACEINTRTDPDNCGSCANLCQLPHATAECSAGECRVATDGCDKGYADCNGDPTDGCEIDLERDARNCGACTKVCPELNGAPFCAAGACQITCSQGFDDCDDKRENGCEKDISRDVNNCGGCGTKCTHSAGGTAYCKDGSCGESICPTGFGDCNGNPDDGCEIDLRTDTKNCDSCGTVCSAANGDATCNNRVCQISTCNKGYANCSGGYADGCETNTNTDIAACGGCGKPCSIDNGTPRCDLGACAVNSCSGNFRDCDGDPKNGCEVNIATSTKNCGGCGAAGSDCSTKYPNAASTCVSSACTAPVCSPGFGDCSGGASDGCETDLTSDINNCGACKVVCGTSNVSGTPSCDSGTCNPTCNPGWGKCTTPEKGCVTPLGTTSNCTKCGEVCSSPTVFCDPAGCVDHRDITVSASGVNAISGWNGTGSPSILTASHTLAYGLNNNRMLLVGVIASTGYLDPAGPFRTSPDTVQYDGVSMPRAIFSVDTSAQSYAAIYYLLDSQLPDSGTARQVRVQFAATNVWGHGGFDVLELKNVTQAAPLATGISSGDNCGNGNGNRSVALSFSQTGSLVYGVMAARGATVIPTLTTGAAPNGPFPHWNAHQGFPADMTGSSGYVFGNTNRSLDWSFTDCFNSAGAGVAIKRLNWN